MKRRILKNASLLVVLSIILTFILMNVILYQKTLQEMQLSVAHECGYIKNAIERYGDDYLNQAVSDISESRITFIDREGAVIFDSARALAEMEQHGQRPEVEAAKRQGIGSDLRKSDTLDKKMYYYAMRLEDGRIIRVCRATQSVLNNISSGFALVGIFLVLFIILVVIIIEKLAKRLVQPINALNLEAPLSNVEYEELSPLLTRIDQQNRQIKKQMRQLKQNQKEYLAITEHMKDGLIVTTSSKVLSVNRAAQKLFGVTPEACIGQDLIMVSRNEVLKEAFSAALAGAAQDKITELNGRIYRILANPVRTKKEKISGTVILIMDITEKQQAENMRKEFTANVSHELKTPLMSISGYAEIIKNGMVRAEDLSDFAGRIYDEAVRLTNLVEDIINLSQLDEQSGVKAMEPLDILEIAAEVKERLQMKAEKSQIELSLEGKSAQIIGVRQVLYEMIYNVCDNAIKYNNPGGYVKMTVRKKKEKEVSVTIRDNGIGIPKEEQSRIFERFYRVDKSHSRKTGGTGLGLSIVKHGAMLHDAKINLESQPGQGTAIKFIFKKARLNENKTAGNPPA